MRERMSFVFLLAWLFVGCGGKPEKKVVLAYPDGKPKLVRYYEHGNDSMLVKEESFYGNSKMEYTGTFKQNRRNGKWTYYYENGKIWSKGSFRDGNSEGLRVVYYDNGMKRYEGNYRDGREQGVWKFYDKEGKLIKVLDFDKENPAKSPGNGAIPDPAGVN